MMIGELLLLSFGRGNTCVGSEEPLLISTVIVVLSNETDLKQIMIDIIKIDINK